MDEKQVITGGYTMGNRKADERRYIGRFTILQEEMDGEIIYNKKSGCIFLDLAKPLDEHTFMGKSYANIAVITGYINTGAVVTLFNNKCINNHTQVGQTQRLAFSCEYLIWSKEIQTDAKYNELVCTLNNAFAWTRMSVFETTDDGIRRKEHADSREFSWFGMKIKFTVFSNEGFWSDFDSEEKTIVQRVQLSISNDEKHTIDEFVSIRDKILALISFAIKNNVNVEDEYLVDYDDSYYITENFENYHKHYLIYAQRELNIYDMKIWDYNFTLDLLPDDKDINKELEKLVPVFNLYLSLFKYKEMPVEMVFLNIVQALETFHSRFFYEDKKKKYVESVMQRFSTSIIFNELKGKLLSDTQMDENCNYIILVSRLNDLLIGNYNTLFIDYWRCEEDYAQKIADTRHYYTHYGKSKEKKALKGDELKDAIFILSRLLEYHICLILGIDIEEKVRQSLSSHHSWKQLEKAQLSEMKVDKNQEIERS
jgi:hypothetical protein